MNRNNCICVVHGAGEHATQLYTSHAHLDVIDLTSSVSQSLLVAFFFGELEVLEGVLNLFLQSLRKLDLLLNAGASSQNLLGFLGVIPEPRRGCLFVEFA